MDGTGPETSKRQRLDSYNVSHRQQQPPIPQAHNFPVSNTLPPPNSSYIHQPLPLSPYHDTSTHEHRSLPEPNPHAYTQSQSGHNTPIHPNPHGYTQPHSGHNTPIRDTRAVPIESTFSRRGSASATTRSPDGYQQFPPPRPVYNATSSDGQHYPQQVPIENPGHFAGYPNNDGPMNGNPHHGLPIPPYSEQSHSNPSGEFNQSPVNVVPHPYGGSTFSNHPSHQNMQRPKKGNRAQQACDVCRTRKAKCDEGRPSCGFCQENSMTCNYQTIAPAKADRANQAILDQLAAQNNEIQDWRRQMEARFDKIEHILASIGAARAMSASASDNVKTKSDNHQAPGGESLDHNVAPDHEVTQPPNKRASAVGASPSGSHITVGTGSSMAVPSGPRTSHPSDVPVTIEHTTAAHRLLRWPSVKALVSKSKSSLSEDYVMAFEEQKGVLRVYGRGEGQDSGDGGHPSSPSASSTSGRSDELHEARSPAPSSDALWGSGLSDIKAKSEIGGLRADGTLIIDPATLYRLQKSYLDNIHILHPFLNKTTLNTMVDNFSMTYNGDKYRQRFSSVSATPTNFDGRVESFSSIQNRGKRKHSDVQIQYAPELSPAPIQPSIQPPLQKSISTAIILLVLALGKICEHEAALPGPIPDNSREIAFRHFSHSPMPPSSEPHSPHSIRQSPISSTQSAGNASIASPLMSSFSPTIKRASEDPVQGQRNIEVIPGLAYYAKATDILGNCHGGNDLAHVQAHLLAGLYAGQLARAFESWSWIFTACRACRYLVREPTLKKENDARADLIRFAFWTCSQLESDILAELDLPRSGIQDIVGVKYPKAFLEEAELKRMDDEESTMMFYYSGQIHIRNVLNLIQSNLHPPDNVENASQRITLRNSFWDTLMGWRTILPARLKWNDTDLPSSDINDARLRAKFYGAVYIVHRPFLRQILDTEIDPQEIQSPQSDSQQGAQSTPSAFSGTMAPPRPFTDEKTYAETLKFAKICIQAAIQSTIAFDSIINHKRLIVTNIFGTAHAQFGNVLVLATTYKSKSLGQLVSKTQLAQLFERTINFLRSHSSISATLAEDAKILELLKRRLLRIDISQDPGGSLKEAAGPAYFHLVMK